jgi:dipeptidyl-peptidase III
LADFTQYNDIRQECGFKNVMVANQISSSQSNEPSPFLGKLDIEGYQKTKSHAGYLWVVFHELLGHGTGLRAV